MLITKSEYVISSPDVEKCPQHDLPEYAFIGRSNVGKSSLINMLTNHAGLAKTSQKPGKTLTINHFLIESKTTLTPPPGETGKGPAGKGSAGKSPEAGKGSAGKGLWHLVDLPGYGYARAGQDQRDKLAQMIQRYCLYREQLISLFVLVDSRLKPQKIDLDFIQWCGEEGVPFAIVFTKADKIGPGVLKQNIATYKQALLESWDELPPIFATSSESRLGADELLDYIDSINQSLD